MIRPELPTPREIVNKAITGTHKVISTVGDFVHGLEDLHGTYKTSEQDHMRKMARCGSKEFSPKK